MEPIHFFDINGEHKENVKIELNKLILKNDSPLRILNEYTSKKNILPRKDEKDGLVVKYNFELEFSKKDIKEVKCILINNFSVSHQSTLNSMGYVIFCDLENSSIFNLLEKVINYIKDNCSLNVKTYIIGVFQNLLREDRTEDNMLEFLDSQDFDYEYFQAYLGDLNESPNDKKKYGAVETMNATLDKLFKEIYNINDNNNDNIHGSRCPIH